MTWTTRMGRMSRGETERCLHQTEAGQPCGKPAAYRVEASKGASPIVTYRCLNCAARMANHLKLPFPPGMWVYPTNA